MYDSYKPDLGWVLRDDMGHIHKWENGVVPTLKTVVDERIERCEDGDTWEEIISHRECALCGQHIVPGYVIDVPAGQVVHIPTTCHISGSYTLKPEEDSPLLGSEKVTFRHDKFIFLAYIDAIFGRVVHFRA